jgi:hypothetical protein
MDMEPIDDNELRDLLRRWEAPDAPPHLEHRIFGAGGPTKRSWYTWLLSGSIRVPVPAAVLLLLVLAALTLGLPRRPQPSPARMDEITWSGFQPVSEMKPRIIRGVYETD